METIILIVTRKQGRKRTTIERAIDGKELDRMIGPEEMLWWQLQRLRRELSEKENQKRNQ